jgi:tripeptide aminopeptidase
MSPFVSTRSAGSLFPVLLSCVTLVLTTPATGGSQQPKTTNTAVAKATPIEAALDRLAKQPAVAKALAALQADNEWTLKEQAAICEIPAPPFKEAARAAVFRDKLAALGVQKLRIDREGNVIGEIRGTGPGPTLVLSGHLDTVFPEGTNVKVKREGTKLTAPGIGDDCRGLAAVLATTRQIVANKIPFTGRLLVVGTMGEEGPGNLRGVRALFTGPMKDSIDMFISVDGTGFGITNGAVGSNRYRVSYKGPGGHSYGAFGMPNPIHAMGRAIAKIADLEAASNPKVTFNVGLVTGGTSVNSISADGVMDIDLRSESAAALADIDARLQVALRQALAEEKARWPKSTVPLTLVIDTTGLRPAGTTPDTSFIVRTSLAAARTMNVYAPLTISSTDANIPISKGVPAVTLDGGGVGRSAHSLDESYDDRTDGYKGPQWILLVVIGLLTNR